MKMVAAGTVIYHGRKRLLRKLQFTIYHYHSGRLRRSQKHPQLFVDNFSQGPIRKVLW